MPVRFVDDYDFVFASGNFLQITVDPLYGDVVTQADGVFEFNLGPKPSPTDPDSMLPAEDIHIKISNLDSWSHRRREVVSRNDEQEEEWKETIRELSKAIN